MFISDQEYRPTKKQRTHRSTEEEKTLQTQPQPQEHGPPEQVETIADIEDLTMKNFNVLKLVK